MTEFSPTSSSQAPSNRSVFSITDPAVLMKLQTIGVIKAPDDGCAILTREPDIEGITGIKIFVPPG